MKLVLHDPAWPLYLPLLDGALKTNWEIVVGANDVSWLDHEIRDADAVMAITLPASARAAASRLKMFVFPGAGVVQRETEELPRGCSLTNVYEHEAPIAEYVLMNILMHVTRIQHYVSTFREGRWDGSGRIGGEPHDEALGKTVGLVGYGHIGQAVAARALAFGMRVVAVRKDLRKGVPPGAAQTELAGGPTDLDHVLRQADFLVIACPLTSETRGMIGRGQLNSMKRSAVLINVSRAEIVAEAALYEALREKCIAAAVLDVWYRYPTEPDQVFRGSALPFHELPNVTLTPHLSAWTAPMFDRRVARIANNLDRLAEGRPLERVVMEGSWMASATGQHAR